MIEAITKRLESLTLVRHDGLKAEIQYFINLINLINSLDQHNTLLRVVDGIVVNLNEIKLPSVFNGLIYPKSIKVIQEVGYPDLLLREKLDTYCIKSNKDNSVVKKENSEELTSTDTSINSIVNKFNERDILYHNTHVAQFAHYYKKSELEVVSKSISELRTELTLLNSLDRLIISKKCHYTADGSSLPLNVNHIVKSFINTDAFNTFKDEIVLRFIRTLVV